MKRESQRRKAKSRLEMNIWSEWEWVYQFFCKEDIPPYANKEKEE